jgi:hypothetical protein
MPESAGSHPAAGSDAETAAVDAAIQALAACDPPDNRALATFIEGHAGRLTAL